MWCAIAYFQGDLHLAKDLLKWIFQQEGQQLPRGCLLCSDPDVDWKDSHEVLQLAQKAFRRVEIVVPAESIQQWPFGANNLFKTAAQYFQGRNIGPWFWCEPDCIPVKKGWLDALEREYQAAKKPFVGAVMDSAEQDMPRKYLAGCAMYPADAWKRMEPAWKEDKAFDIATAAATVPEAYSTVLIQHFWGLKDLPPTFVESKTPSTPVNAFTLGDVHSGAVVFHRNKDGTLLKLLGFHQDKKQQIVIDVVLPIHPGDARLMLKNLKWMNAFHGRKSARAIVLADLAIDKMAIEQVVHEAEAVFERVTCHRYSSNGFAGWPAGPNRAFQEACRYMAGTDSNGWLWMEADSVPVKEDWLEQLSVEYVRGKKPFGGTIIDHMGHLNGLAIYPRNVAQYAPSVRKMQIAFDVALGHEIAPHRHRMNSLIQHHLSPPSFASAPDLRAIEPSVVLFHPDKSGQLLDRLAEAYL